MGIIKGGNNGTTKLNSFSEPDISLRTDPSFTEEQSWELRSDINQKGFVNQPPLFSFVFSDWINIEGKGKDELKSLENYGENKYSFFEINKAVKTHEDMFYLVVNVRIVSQRQSVAIFVCKKEQWKTFLQKNVRHPKEMLDNQDQSVLLHALKSCFKVKGKFWTIPTCGSFKNPFVFSNILDNDS